MLSECRNRTTRRAWLGALVLLGLGAAASWPAPAQADDGRWAQIRASLFGDRPIEDAGNRLELVTPERALDAAIVPISFAAHAPRSSPDGVQVIHLIIDNNPAPLAGVFRFPADGADPALATRVRINEYTPVRIVAETVDGRLLMTERFVKASGGCSAPAGKDQDAALARLGRMKLNGGDTARIGKPSTVQVLLSHPNNSGLQFDPILRTYVPPYYLTSVEVSYGGRLVFSATTDISISEDPSFHLTFVPDRPDTLAVRAEDTKAGVFEGRWAIGGTAAGG